MELGLEGKVAIVTGGSRGIGLATATTLMVEGSAVLVCGRSPEKLENARKWLDGIDPGHFLAIQADINRSEDIARMVDLTVAKWGRIDILVNCAGTTLFGGLNDVSGAVWREAFEVKVSGMVGMVSAVAPHMRERGGRIVNVIGESGSHPNSAMLPSSAANGAAFAVTKALADGLAPVGIGVNSVAVARVRGELWNSAIVRAAGREGISEEDAERMRIAEIPMKRLGRPEEVGYAIAFLCSERVSFISGATLAVDGGYRR